MSLTYPEDRPSVSSEGHYTPVEEAAYTPVYARTGAKRRGQKKVKTWMILAPIGAVMLLGAAALLMSEGNESTPLVEPDTQTVLAAPPAPLVAPAPLTAAIPAPVTLAPAPVVRQETAPVRRAAPAPVRRAEPRAAPVARDETPDAPTGPRAYAPSAATPAPVVTPAPARPAITVQPLN